MYNLNKVQEANIIINKCQVHRGPDLEHMKGNSRRIKKGQCNFYLDLGHLVGKLNSQVIPLCLDLVPIKPFLIQWKLPNIP